MTNTIDIQTRYRTFEVKYIGASNTKPSRFKIKDLRHGTSKTLSYRHEHRDCQESAIQYLEFIGISVDAMAMTDNNSFLLSEDFSTELK